MYSEFRVKAKDYTNIYVGKVYAYSTASYAQGWQNFLNYRCLRQGVLNSIQNTGFKLTHFSLAASPRIKMGDYLHCQKT